MTERNGTKRSFHVPSVNAKNLRPILEAQIAKKAALMTDEAKVYVPLGKDFASHQTVNHAAKEYSRGDVTTNTVESSFSLLKRGLIGTFHHVDEWHLQRYVTEFDFRWNTRTKLGFSDVDRAAVALKNIGGKRLTYAAADQEKR
jgi:transposase-like protein